MDVPIPFDADLVVPILDGAFDGIALFTHSPWRLQFANRTLATWLEKPASELSGMPLEHVFGTQVQSLGLEQQLNRALLHSTLEVEATLSLDLGSKGATTMLVKAFRLTGHDKPLIGLVLRPLASTVDFPTRHATRVDPLTALPDRTFLLSRLATLLNGERVADREFAVLFIDVNDFKQVNDRNGHLIGDRALREVAQRLQGCVRECDHVTRFGGDEFVVLLERVPGVAEIEPVLARIQAALAEPLMLSEERVMLSVSVGVARSSPHHQTPEDILDEADRQMYAAKRGASRGGIQGAAVVGGSPSRDASTAATNV